MLVAIYFLVSSMLDCLFQFPQALYFYFFDLDVLTRQFLKLSFAYPVSLCYNVVWITAFYLWVLPALQNNQQFE